MNARGAPRGTVTPAVYWFNRQRSRDMTAEDIRAFEAWLAQDALNKKAFDKVERLWALVGDVEDEPAIADLRDEDERTLATWGRRRAIAAAGAFAILAGSVILMRAGWLPAFSNALPPPQEIRTAVGQRATVTLSDQSRVTLDTDTLVLAQMRGRERHVELVHGRAFFDVAKEQSRPFVVKAGDRSVRATGTAFDVRAEPGRFEVTLIEGRVRVEEAAGKDTRAAEIRPGWRLAAGADARWRIEPVDLRRQTSWHDGTLNFFNEPITGAVAEMNRYSTRKIVFRGEPPNRVLIGVFRAGDVETFTDALEVNQFVKIVSRSEDRIEIAAR